MKTFILTEGSESKGFGHIIRCIALYDELKKRKLNPYFIASGDKSIHRLLKNKRHIILNWVNNNKERNRLIQNSDCIIIDSYQASRKTYTSISKFTKLLVCIDDNNRINYPDGIITNSAINAHSFSYPKSRNKIYLLGEKYILLRNTFEKIRSKKTVKVPKTVLVTLGGTDLRNLSNQLLSLLVKHYPELRKNVIIGSGFSKINIGKIRKVRDKNTKLIYSPNTAVLKKYMHEAHIGISASGQTINELSRVGLPTIGIIVADNQKNNALGWSKKGFIINAGNWNNHKLPYKIIQGINRLTPRKEREKRKNIGQSLVDGLGAERIVNTIINKLK